MRLRDLRRVPRCLKPSPNYREQVNTNPEIGVLLERYKSRQAMAELYVQAYRKYCWPVQTLNDLKLAPFHLMASEGAVHIDKPHTWHMEIAARLSNEVQAC